MFLATMNDIKDISFYNTIGVIVGIKGLSTRMEHYFDIDELPKIYKECKGYNKLLYLQINRLIHEFELPLIDKLFNTIKDLNISGIFFHDFSVYQKSLTYNLNNILIYKPDTLVTNTRDFNLYSEDISSCVISNEITLDDINHICENTNKKTYLVIHGYINMFYSKRKLLKRYAEFTHDLAVEKGYLIEELREDKLPILEDESGTNIFRGKVLASYDVFKELKVDFYIIDNLFQDAYEVNALVSSYENNEKLIFDDYDDGFYFKKTVYQKKEDN